MSVHRYSAKRDANEPEIIKALTQAGASVQKLSDSGVPDLLVGLRGKTFLLEIKAGRNGLNDVQKTWHNEFWRGEPPIIVRSIGEAFHAVGLLAPDERGED